MRRLAPAALALLLLAFLPLTGAADDDARSGLLRLLPAGDSVTHHALPGDQGLRYTATAGTLPLRDGKGEVKAEMFYVSYAAEEARAERPLTFVFNGGPGAGAAFLNLGALGPRTLAFTPRGAVPPPPPLLEDNPDTWLPFTDLVFVDPVGTGYSRTAESGDEAQRQYWGVKPDLDAMATFITRYVARNERALSPKFLVGESYGGFRAVLLAHELQTRTGLAPSGVVLVSPVLEFALLGHDDWEALPWALRLPSLAAAHVGLSGMGGDALETAMHEAENFALTDYLRFLAQGSAASDRDAIYARVAGLTGLPVTVVGRAHGRISASLFIKEAGRDRGEVLSRYDATVGGPDPDPTSPVPDAPDAVLDAAIAPWTAGFTAYVRQELGYKADFAYQLLNREISGKWDYGRKRQGYAGALDELTKAVALNPRLHVLIVHGATDLVTPYFASRYLVRQMPEMSGTAPVEVAVYPGGHMPYMRRESRTLLHRDAEALYRAALAPP